MTLAERRSSGVTGVADDTFCAIIKKLVKLTSVTPATPVLLNSSTPETWMF
jgi:hypothetical protein